MPMINYIHIRENFFKNLFKRKPKQKKLSTLLKGYRGIDDYSYLFKKFIPLAKDLKEGSDIFLTLEDFSQIENITCRFIIKKNIHPAKFGYGNEYFYWTRDNNVGFVWVRSENIMSIIKKPLSLQNLKIAYNANGNLKSNEFWNITDGIKYDKLIKCLDSGTYSIFLEIHLPTKKGEDILQYDPYQKLKEELDNLLDKFRLDYGLNAQVSEYYNYNKEIIFYVR